MFINDWFHSPNFCDPGTLVTTGLGNQSGDLQVCLVKGVPHICVTCEVRQDYWRPCSRALYDAILAEMRPDGCLEFPNDGPKWESAEGLT